MAPKRARSPTDEADRAAARAAWAAKRESAARAKAAREAERAQIKERRDDERSRSIVERRLEEIVMEVARDIVRRKCERLP